MAPQGGAARIEEGASLAITLEDGPGRTVTTLLDRAGPWRIACIDAGASFLEEHGEAFLDAAMLVSLTVESVGIMVHRGVVEFDMVWGLMGGLVLGAWERVEGWAIERFSPTAAVRIDISVDGTVSSLLLPLPPFLL